MNALRAIFVAGAVTLAMVLLISSFNYYVDPLCYFHCGKIDVNRRTVNLYYQIGQKIRAHPDAQVVILGSSRGQTTPLKWVEDKTGYKALNLSIGGAELTAKLAFLNIALESEKLKEVIWYADYFELIVDTADAKVRSTPALRSYLNFDLGTPGIETYTHDALKLIDHNTLEASFYALKNPTEIALDRGSGSRLDYKICERPDYKGEKSVKDLEKENGISYDTYTRNVLKPTQSGQEWDLFVAKLKSLAQKNIRVIIVIPPYNPGFTQRLQAEYPEIYENHGRWVKNLVDLSIPGVRILNYFNGIPHDDSSPRYWNDGVHFTCKGAIEMLDGQI